MKNILLLLCATMLTGCHSTIGFLAGANRNHQFASRDEAAAHFNKKNHIDPAKLFFFDDAAQQSEFMQELAGKPLDAFYALAVNDSLKIAANPEANNWCAGVAADFLATAANDSLTAARVYLPHGLKGMQLSNRTGQPLNLNAAKPTVIFVVHSAMGRLINGNTRYIIETTQKEGLDLNYIYIALDRPMPITKA